MLSRRTSSPTNSLGFILGLTIPFLTLFVLCALLVLWRRRLRNARNKSGSKPTRLTLHRARSEKHSAPNSASSYASTFNFPPKNRDDTLTDLKDPFHFPKPFEKPVPLATLPPLPSQAVVLTAYRTCTIPAPRKVEMDKSTPHSTQGTLHPHSVYHKEDEKDDLEGWELGYYEESLPTTRPPSYNRSPSRTRSHSPISHPLRSASFRQSGILSRKPYANAPRPMSQPIDITVSTDVHVHIDSLYVESHAGGDGQTDGNEEKLRIMSVAPQIPSIYLGVPFDAFGKLEGEIEAGTFGERMEEPAAPECTLDDPQTVNPARSSHWGSSPTTMTTNVRNLDRVPVKNGRTIPAGWF